MRRIKGKSILFLAIVTMVFSSSELPGAEKNGGSSFLSLALTSDARSSALGNTGIGRGEDVSVLYWNVGGLGLLPGWEVSVSGDSYIDTVNHGAVGFRINVKGVGAFGVRGRYLTSGDILTFKNGSSTGTQAMSSFGGGVMYGREIRKGIGIGAGVHVSVESLPLDGTDSVGALTVGLDLGFLWKDFLTEGFHWGVVGKNIGINGSFGNVKGSPPRGAGLGLSYRVSLSEKEKHEINFSGDMNYLKGVSLQYGIGVEWQKQVGIGLL